MRRTRCPEEMEQAPEDRAPEPAGEWAEAKLAKGRARAGGAVLVPARVVHASAPHAAKK